ncbi:MAG TPA: ABC transporter permease, partial [Bryobacteraceae bacterium]|nr:ABC transporter permease [Bryobacteraceae bacterium]
VDAVRLRTLPVQDPQNLVVIDFAEGSNRSGWFSTRSARHTSNVWREIRTRQEAFSGIMAWSATRFNLANGGPARLAEGLYVSGDFFRVLGVSASVGRTFTPEDDKPECAAPGAVISSAFWQREFAGDPKILNRTISLDGRVLPVVGVTSPSFFGVEVGSRYDVAVPLCVDTLLSEDGKGRVALGHAWWLSAMGRLKPGWTPERATSHLQALSPAIMRVAVPTSYRAEQAKRFLANKLVANPGATGVSNLRRRYETPLWMLLATTAAVLLIACANLANLLLARASVREKEIAVRLAMGAGRGRLVRQLLSESLLLAICGASLGAVIAQVLSRALVAFLTTQNNPLFVGLGFDFRVLGFTAALAVATCVLFGLVPAWRATRLAPASAMRASGRGTTSGRERNRLRRMLVVTQVALSLMLLVGALLFVRSLGNLMTVDAGFRPEGILSVDVSVRPTLYAKERLPEVYREIHRRLSAQPAIVSVAQVAITPISGSSWNSRAWGGHSGGEGKDINFNRVGPGYFKTMETTVLAGRDFDDRDALTAPKVAVVNEAVVKALFAGKEALGQTFRVEAEAGKPDNVYQIVGIVRNTKYQELREDFRPIAFLPMAQEEDVRGNTTFVIRTGAGQAGVLNGVKSAIAEVHPEIGLISRVLTTQLRESLLRERLMATLSAAFGILAGVLATIGLYGVIAYMVERRRNEIGVRMALGADRLRVVWLVVREAGMLLVAGLIVGTGLALWAGRAAGAMLYGLKPYDPATLAAAIVLLAGVALVATYAPARRASRLDPMVALREE